MAILLCYTSAFSEVIYTDFYAKILDWNFRLLDENSQILVAIFVSKLSFSFRFVDENCRIFVVVVFVTKINLFSSTKIFVFVIVDEKNTDLNPRPTGHPTGRKANALPVALPRQIPVDRITNIPYPCLVLFQDSELFVPHLSLFPLLM